jgi:Caspase domain
MRQLLLTYLLIIPFGLQAQVGYMAARTALVIGNAAYTKPDAALKNSVSDARLMKQTFESLGFEVIYREDVDRRGMSGAFRDFQELVRKKKGIAAFYFAGHGVQVQGRNYIVPIGAHLQKDTDARDAALDVDVMLQAVRDTGAQLNLFILDACRNNPLIATQRGNAGGAEGSAAVGLAQMTPPAGALIAFATEPGHVAADGLDAGHGLYTKHLARWLKEPSLTLEQVFKRTREAVKRESGDLQTPMEYSLLTGADVYLVKPITRLPEPVAATGQGKFFFGVPREAKVEDVASVVGKVSLEDVELAIAEQEQFLQQYRKAPTFEEIGKRVPTQVVTTAKAEQLQIKNFYEEQAKFWTLFWSTRKDQEMKSRVAKLLGIITKIQAEFVRIGLDR